MDHRTILVVDDDTDLSDNLKDILEDEGFRVFCAGTRKEGLALAEELRPKAAILDERLPDGSGTHLISEIRETHPDCVCVIMTAYADLESVTNAIERGVFHYLLKPISPNELLRVLNRVFETLGLREEKRRAEEALRESERRFREILENVRLVSVCLDTRGVVTFANDFLLELTGREREEVIGRNWFDLFTARETSEKALKGYLDRIAQKSISLHGESSIVTKDGAVRAFSWNNTLLRNPEGEIVGMAAIGEDITERKRAVAALEESEARVRSILDHMQAGMILIDARTRKIVDANPVALEVLGRSKEDITGADWLDFLGNATETPDVEQEAGEHADHTEAVVLRADGTKVPVLRTVVPTTLGNRPYLVASFVDLTDRKALEEERLKAEKLEALGLLAGGIAHDFNNLLTAILGNISLCKMGLRSGELGRRRLGEAERAALRAKDLTQQLLVFASGGEPLKTTASLGELVTDAGAFVVRGSKSLCRCDVPEDLWLSKVDQGQITQVLYNIVINADQAMPEGGIIRVDAQNVTIGNDSGLGLQPGDYVKITVADGGIGIPEEHLKRIFDPYFTTKAKGTGLGLTTAWSVVKNHNGTITVESTPGVGTTFSVYLPASPDRTIVGNRRSTQPISGKGRILVMDDEEMIRDLMADLLGSLGYDAAFAAEGAEAVELYTQAAKEGKPFDAVIMDLTIPGGMGGKAAIEELRRIHPEARAIVSSGYSNDPVMAGFVGCGFDDMIAKPFSVEELSAVLNKVLQKAPRETAHK